MAVSTIGVAAMRCRAFIAASIDGFIARSDGSLDWLGSVAVEGEDYGYAEFMDGVDAIVMGRSTYEVVLGFPDWPYTVPVVVMSGSPQKLARTRADVRFSSLALPELVQMLRREGYANLYVDGGRVVTSFLKAGLLDEITINRIPILLGEGIPLFSEVGRDIRLHHEETRPFSSGLVRSRYVRPDASERRSDAAPAAAVAPARS